MSEKVCATCTAILIDDTFLLSGGKGQPNIWSEEKMYNRICLHVHAKNARSIDEIKPCINKCRVLNKQLQFGYNLDILSN